MDETPYTTKDIVEKLHIPMQRLRMWLLNNFFEPTKPSEGQGKKAFFSKLDMYAIELFVKLLAKGFKRELAAEYIRSFQEVAQIMHLAPFILFVTKRTEDGLLIEPGCYNGMNPLELAIAVDKISVRGFGADSEACVWEDVIIINFAQLKADVDKKLG